MKMKLKLRKSFRRHVRKTRSSLVAQQLGFDAFNCGDPALILVREPTYMPCNVAKIQKKRKRKRKKEKTKRKKTGKKREEEKGTWRPVQEV